MQEGLLLDKASVEVAVRPKLFWSSGKKNIFLRGIIFQHANTALDEPAVRFYASSNILVEIVNSDGTTGGGLVLGVHAHNGA